MERNAYKKMWQEAVAEIERQKTTISNLHRDIEKLAAAVMNGRAERGQTRQIVDLAGVARHMGVERYTPQQWKQRGLMPPVDFPEIKEPLWYASTIKDHFAGQRGRLWLDSPLGEELSPAA